MNTIYIGKFRYTPKVTSQNSIPNVSVATDEGPSPKLAMGEGASRGKYRKLAANVVQTLPLQLPSDDLSFVVS